MKGTHYNKNNKLIIRFRKHKCNLNKIYDIVVLKKKTKNLSNYIEKLGYLNLKFTERRFIINTQRLIFFVKNGVEVDDKVKKYFVKFLV